MIDPAVLPAFLVAVVLVTIAPGPDMAYIVAVAVDRGPRAGLMSAGGMALGMIVHVAVAAAGLAVIVRSTPWALDAVRLAGAGYLAWLAVDTLRSAGEAGPARRELVADRHIVRRATATNLANPKVILFFAAFLPQFVRPGGGPAGLQFLILGLTFLVVGLAIDSVVGVAAGRVRDAMAPGGRAATAMSILAGATFATLALLLVVDVVADH